MQKHLWLVPAAASLAFFAYSVGVMISDGPFGFLTVHTGGGWGEQIGLDLINSATLALFFAAPLAKKYDVRMLPWIVLTILLGSIGLLAFAARLLYVRADAKGEPSVDPRGRAVTSPA